MRQRPDLPGLVNGPVLVVSALLASPACVLLAQGLLTVTDVLTRYLLITVGCMALWAFIRAGLVAIVARPAPTGAEAADHAITGVVLDPAVTPAQQPRTVLDPDALDMPPEDLIQLSLRNANAHQASE